MKVDVSMEQAICPVCGCKHETGAVLLGETLVPDDKKVTRYKVTGYAFCEEHQKLYDDKYVALIAIDPNKATDVGNTLSVENIYKTGEFAHIHQKAFVQLFKADVPSKGIAFCSPEDIEALKEMASFSK